MREFIYKLPCVVLGWFFLAIPVGVAHTPTYPVYYSGIQMSKLCIDNSPTCFAYVSAIADYGYESGLYAVASGHESSAQACIRWGYSLTKMVAVIRSFIIQHPYVENMPSGFDVVNEAISDSFPC
jgi:hypothetical protein